jgi:signal transduction histidine kinase
MHLDLDEVRIAELVMQAVNTSTDADIPVDIDAELAGVVLQADKRRLVRVIANLLDNAAKYGGGATGVEVHLVRGDRSSEHSEPDVVQIVVEDRGEGVPADERERVFERFARGMAAAGSRGSGEGAGLGLALVKEHVTLHGGRVFVTNRLDGTPGSRFVVELPVVTGEEEPVEEEALPAAAVLVSDLIEEQQA